MNDSLSSVDGAEISVEADLTDSDYILSLLASLELLLIAIAIDGVLQFVIKTGMELKDEFLVTGTLKPKEAELNIFGSPSILHAVGCLGSSQLTPRSQDPERRHCRVKLKAFGYVSPC